MCCIDILDILCTKNQKKIKTPAVQIGKSIEVEKSKRSNGKYLPILVLFVIQIIGIIFFFLYIFKNVKSV